MFVEIAIELLQLLIVAFGSPLLVGVIRKQRRACKGGAARRFSSPTPTCENCF